jgi:hypothetical protein
MDIHSGRSPFSPVRSPGLDLFSLATFQTGEVGVDLPECLQLRWAGNTVRGWNLGQYVAKPVHWHGRCTTLQYVRASIAGMNFYAGLHWRHSGTSACGTTTAISRRPRDRRLRVGLRLQYHS